MWNLISGEAGYEEHRGQDHQHRAHDVHIPWEAQWVGRVEQIIIWWKVIFFNICEPQHIKLVEIDGILLK